MSDTMHSHVSGRKPASCGELSDVRDFGGHLRRVATDIDVSLSGLAPVAIEQAAPDPYKAIAYPVGRARFTTERKLDSSTFGEVEKKK